jgi:hypothetical protein
MLIILYHSSCRELAEQAVTDLEKAFPHYLEAVLYDATSTNTCQIDIAWDDLLVVIFNEEPFPDNGKKFISQYIKKREDRALLLPVATNPTSSKPPSPIDSIKALVYNESAKGETGQLVNRIGGMLNFKLTKRESKIFISYRAVDGSCIANQLYEYLTRLGYTAWLDEAKEPDGEGKILSGKLVQDEIHEALQEASIMLLLDTPQAPNSTWVNEEVYVANSILLPILPICLRETNDDKQGPRFRSLRELQRWVSLPFSEAGIKLSVGELDIIVAKMEKYLCEIFQRKCRVPSLVKTEFSSQGYDWNEVDKRLMMFKASKIHNKRIGTHVLSHCSIFDQIFLPNIKIFENFIRESDPCNFSLFIYDGEIISDSQLDEIEKEVGKENKTLIILHHQELAVLVSSNFTKFRAVA